MNWQPIESAPKDGTNLLLYWPSGAEVDHYQDEPAHVVAVARWESFPNGRGAWRGYYSGIGPSFDEPTHWMPLPAPPVEKIPASEHMKQSNLGH